MSLYLLMLFVDVLSPLCQLHSKTVLNGGFIKSQNLQKSIFSLLLFNLFLVFWSNFYCVCAIPRILKMRNKDFFFIFLMHIGPWLPILLISNITDNFAGNIASNIADSAQLLAILLIIQQYCWQYWRLINNIAGNIVDSALLLKKKIK